MYLGKKNKAAKSDKPKRGDIRAARKAESARYMAKPNVRKAVGPGNNLQKVIIGVAVVAGVALWGLALMNIASRVS